MKNKTCHNLGLNLYWRGRGPGVGVVLLYHFTNEILTKSNFVLRTSMAFSWFSRELVTLAPRADVRHSGLRPPILTSPT